MMECKCNMRTKLVGDGCSKCNPELYIDILKDQISDYEATETKLRELVEELRESSTDTDITSEWDAALDWVADQLEAILED